MKFKNLLLGLVAGAGLGVLFAPKTGKDLREKIKKEREKGGTGLNEIKEAMTESAVEVVDYSQKLWKKAEKFLEEKINEEEGVDEKKSKKGKK